MTRSFCLIGMGLGIMILLSVCGCQEKDNSAMIRQTKLVAEENIQLKQQLSDCQKEVEQQKRLVEKATVDNAEIAKQTGDNNIKLLQIVAQSGKQVEELTAENARLKARIQELEAKLSGTTAP
ncbi:MAG: hypothetical protein JW828_10400 [Sedimentisphaerales bacterium]|nr:hypothetical protein [Sedimentisphaerales bacterium]